MAYRLYTMLPVRTYKGSTFEIPAFLLGEKGRGRELVIVPTYEGAKTGDVVDIVPTKSGKSYRIVPSKNIPEGWVAILSGSGVYTRGTLGEVVPVQKEQVKKLAYGYGAWGLAGRIGTYYEYLFVVSPPYPVIFRVRPAGGKYKIPRYWLVFWGDRVDKVTDEEADIYADQHNIEFPDPKSL